MNGRNSLNEDNLIKDEFYQAFKESIICPICNEILLEPMMCMNCQNVFCKDCIETWKKKDNKCPFRCENPIYKMSNEKNSILFNLKFECENCGEIFNYQNILNHSNCTPKTNIPDNNIKYDKKIYKTLTIDEIKENKKQGKLINKIKSNFFII